MVEIQTKTCRRCDTEFDIDEQYLTMEISHHLHPEAVENGMDPENEFYIMCNECVGRFYNWIDSELEDDIDINPPDGGLFAGDSE